jgi:uncharacterized peroxidase-related enzyme
MSYIHIIAPEDATGTLAELYQADIESVGYVPNYTRAFSLRPEANAAWRHLIKAIRTPLSLRRYELATIAAARAMSCQYCTLAHGSILKSNFFSGEEVAQLIKDFHQAGLSAEEVAIMEFAEKVTLNASRITPDDVDALRQHGLSDTDILDIILTTAARAFFSKVLDATGALPDAVYDEFASELEAAQVG